MAIQQRLSQEQQLAYEAFKTAVHSLREINASLGVMGDELGVELQVGDLVDMYDMEDDSIQSFLDLVEVTKEA